GLRTCAQIPSGWVLAASANIAGGWNTNSWKAGGLFRSVSGQPDVHRHAASVVQPDSSAISLPPPGRWPAGSRSRLRSSVAALRSAAGQGLIAAAFSVALL